MIHSTPSASSNATPSLSSPPPEAHAPPDPTPPTVHGHTDAEVSPDERIPQSPAVTPGSTSAHHGNTRRGDSRQIAHTRRGAGSRARRAGYQSRTSMFHSAQSTIINGGEFYLAQGDISHIPRARRTRRTRSGW
jgi:hypothetical protein